MYLAIKLDTFSKESILNYLKNFIPKWSIVLENAIMYNRLPKRTDVIGKKYELIATHFGYSDGAIALKVRTSIKDDDEFIVPIAVNKKKGYTISNSKDIKTWFKLNKKIVLSGVLSQYYNGNKVSESEIENQGKSKIAIFRVAFYDFDNTLVEMPNAEFAKEFWQRSKGTAYTKLGWWSKEESLDRDVFDFKPIPDVVKKLKRDFNDSLCWTVLLTNRLEKLKKNVNAILNDLNIELDEFKMVAKSNMTKPMRIKEVLSELPQCNLIDVYDDDPGNIELFKELKKELEMDGKTLRIFFINPKNYIPRITKVI